MAPTPRPRIDTPEAPAAKPLVKPSEIVPLLLTGSTRMISEIVDRPERSISSRVITWTGDAVSVSTRRMFVPVTWIETSAACAFANSNAPPTPNMQASADAICLFWNAMM